MRLENQPAFILHARPWRETSLLLEAFTRDHGRVGLVARGVRSARSRLPRASLQPLQPLLLDWIARGELGTLTSAEPTGTRWRIKGDALLAGMYVNELVLRLTSRNDAHPAAFAAYTECLVRLAEDADIAWTLRRFERDVLDDLGYGLNLSAEAVSGADIDPQRHYGYRHEVGPVEWRGSGDGPRISGATLIALAADLRPPDADLAPLRRWLRAVIAAHLDGAELQAWRMFDGAARAVRG